ncbi:MAG: alpha/beta hydrolase-fold protein, partial [Lutibacter sp.]
MKSYFTIFSAILLTSSMVFSQNASEKKSTAASNVLLLKKEFVIPNLNSISHKVWIYLPPNYDKSSKKYPVIYMHDAQNLFDAATSYAGE